jgi:predicted SprT family Zn-dependent metalloprotease
MNLLHAQQLAIQLMDEHGLLDKGWSIEFDTAKSRFGSCRYRSRVIGLSKPLTMANDLVQVKDTILHEIAHALVGVGHGHDNVWKRMCVAIGAKPERCYSAEDTNLIAGKYRAVCGGCGEVYSRHKRVPTDRRHACKCQSHIKDWSKKKLLEYKVAMSN